MCIRDRFNRGLLLSEVSANDLALEDFNRVLELDPDDYRALYNRAMIHQAKGNTEAAIADITRVAEQFPDFPGALYLRASLYRNRGQLAKAEADYKKAQALAKALDPTHDYAADSSTENSPKTDTPANNSAAPDAALSKRFASLLTVNDNADFREEYNNSAIRGRIQDRNLNIELEPMMMLSFYSSPTELRKNTYYIREVDDLNATRMLRFILVVTNNVPTLDQATVERHFQSIDYYNSYLSTHNPRPVDYIGRALDFITVRDYQNAEKDADRAISLTPDLALAYLIRAQARYGQHLLAAENPDDSNDHMTRKAKAQARLADINADLDKVIELSPRMPIAYFNKGNILFEMEDFDGAAKAFSEAIQLKSDFGEAYYNRGYIRLKSGLRAAGIADLSKAGELGIIPAYNLIKRISK